MRSLIVRHGDGAVQEVLTKISSEIIEERVNADIAGTETVPPSLSPSNVPSVVMRIRTGRNPVN